MGDADQLVDVAPDHRHPGEAPREHDVEHGIEVGVGVDAHHVGPGHHHRPDHRVAELEDRADHLALLRLDDLLGLGHLEHRHDLLLRGDWPPGDAVAGQDQQEDAVDGDEGRHQGPEGGPEGPDGAGGEQHHLVGALQDPAPGGDLGELEQDEGHHRDRHHRGEWHPAPERHIGHQHGGGHPGQQHRQQRCGKVGPGIVRQRHQDGPPAGAQFLEVACPGVGQAADRVHPDRGEEGKPHREGGRHELPAGPAHDACAPERPQTASSRLRMAAAAASESWS